MRTGRACGKVILVGEHAVVYGVPAIAVGIDRGARAYAAPLESGPSRLHVRGWNIDVCEGQSEPNLARAFGVLIESVRSGVPSLPPMMVEVEADVPPAAGLGCSAAIGVAVARAVDPAPSEHTLHEHVMAWERVFHGNPSGIDGAVAARGGCIFFRRRETIEPVRLGAPLHLCIGSTGVASSTKAMVEAVALLRARQPEVIQESFEGVRVLVHSARAAIAHGDRSSLGRLMDLNQTLLDTLFLSTPDIERMCSVARASGALGAKLTGAGGGGSVIALVASPTDANSVLAAWRDTGFEGFATAVHPELQPIAVESGTSP